MAQESAGRRQKDLWGKELVRLAGWLAIAVSLALLAVVLVRGVGLNAVNGWTIVLGAAGGAVAASRSGINRSLAAGLLMLVAMIPALFGGLGLLYLPSLVLLVVGGRAVEVADDPRR